MHHLLRIMALKIKQAWLSVSILYILPFFFLFCSVVLLLFLVYCQFCHLFLLGCSGKGTSRNCPHLNIISFSLSLHSVLLCDMQRPVLSPLFCLWCRCLERRTQTGSTEQKSVAGEVSSPVTWYLRSRQRTARWWTSFFNRAIYHSTHRSKKSVHSRLFCSFSFSSPITIPYLLLYLLICLFFYPQTLNRISLV